MRYHAVRNGCSWRIHHHSSSTGGIMSDFSFKDFNRSIIDEFRANGGEVSAPVAKPLILLGTVGAKSGEARLNPVSYFMEGDRMVIIASKAGMPSNPDWYYNLLANPEVTVETGKGERYPARATPVTDMAERDRLYAKMVERNPGFAEYERNTTRKIPVVYLDRIH
jgi:deazaflavin-dependent oxidoreductase (nitroreductase family)